MRGSRLGLVKRYHPERLPDLESPSGGLLFVIDLLAVHRFTCLIEEMNGAWPSIVPGQIGKLDTCIYAGHRSKIPKAIKAIAEHDDI